MRIPLDGEIEEILKSLIRARLRDISGPDIPAQHLSDLEIDQVRRAQQFPGVEDPLGDPNAGVSSKNELKRSRGVEDDHRDSRSSRSTSAGGTGGVTGVLDAIRRVSSTAVGRMAVRRNSSNR